MSGSLRIGSLLGIPVFLHYTWLAIFALFAVNLTLLFGSETFALEWSLQLRIGVAIGTTMLFFASVVAHELSHSVVALHYKIPVLSITLFIFGGVANIGAEATSARQEGRIAIAGPLTSIALAAFFGLIAYIIGGDPEAMGRPREIVSVAASWLALVNLALGLFNLIPGFPMDGGRVLRAIIWWRTNDFTRATFAASLVGRGFGFLLIIGGAAEILLLQSFAGLWLMLIGWFISTLAGASYNQVRTQSALEGVTARDMMTQNPPTVPSHATVDLLVTGYLLPSGQRCAYVSNDSAYVGIVSVTDIRELDRDKWNETPVREIMTPWANLVSTRSQTLANEVMNSLVEHNLNQIPIIDDAGPIGMVTRESLLEAIRTRSELQRR